MVTARHPNRPDSALALTEQHASIQVQRGLYTVHRGVPMPIPVDHIKRPTVYLNRELWRQDAQGRVYRPGTRMTAPGTLWQGKALAWMRDHVDERIPALYYRAVLGHDLHVSTWADLYARHFHAGWANPFNPDKFDSALDPTFETLRKTHWPEDPRAEMAHEAQCRLGSNCPARRFSWEAQLALFSGLFGFIEDCGWLSGAKVTTAFVSEEIDELVSAVGSEYADFDFHEVGTDNTAESNAQTALIATSGIARATGTPTDADPIYRSVATITADTTETWQEHGIFNNSSGAAMMDRNLTGGQSVNNLDQVQYTYELTKNPEA